MSSVSLIGDNFGLALELHGEAVHSGEGPILNQLSMHIEAEAQLSGHSRDFNQGDGTGRSLRSVGRGAREGGGLEIIPVGLLCGDPSLLRNPAHGTGRVAFPASDYGHGDSSSPDQAEGWGWGWGSITA